MTDTKNVVVTRVFDASVDDVWSAWTESDKVKQWWGPTSFTCPVADMDVKVGGTSLVCMHAPQEFGGMDIFNSWTYTNIEPGKRLQYIMKFTDKDGNAFDPATAGMPAGVPKEVPHTVTFEAEGDKTKVTVTEEGYTTDEAVNLSRPGLEQCLDKMAAMFAK